MASASDAPDAAAAATKKAKKDNVAASTSPGSLSLSWSLGVSGFKSGFYRDNVVFAGDNGKTVVYPLGRQLVFRDITAHKNNMKHLPRGKDARAVTAMTVSQAHNIMAVCECEQDDARAKITIYHISLMRKNRTLISPTRGNVASCAFTPNGELYTLTDGEEPMITGWRWQKSKAFASASVGTSGNTGTSATRIRCNPRDSKQVTTSGNKHLRYWTLEPQTNTLKPSSLLREVDKYIDHVWLKDGHLIVLTAEKLFVFHRSPDTGTPVAQLPITGDFMRAETIVACNKGFILGGKAGFISVYEETSEPAEPFLVVKTFSGQAIDHIRCMSISPNEEHAVCYLDGDRLTVFPLHNVDSMKEKGNNMEGLVRTGIHSDTIVAMDVCHQRSIFVTVGRDRYVNIWNYETWQCELSDLISDDPTCVACHPAGFQMLIGSRERARMYNILTGKLAFFVDVPGLKHCKQAKFSHGGQYFACTAGLNILIYTTYEMRCINTLTGHIAPPSSLLWSTDDNFCISAGLDGGVYGWDVERGERAEQIDTCEKNCKFTSIVCSNDKTQLTMVGRAGPKSGKEVKQQYVYQIINGQIDKFPVDTGLTKLALPKSNDFLYAGTESGAIRVYNWPLPETGAQSIISYVAHSGPVTHMCLSADQKHLISASSDGSVFVFNINLLMTAPDGSRIYRRHFFNTDVTMQLIEDVEETNSKVESLQTRIDDMKQKKKYDKHIAEQEHEDQIRELKEKNAKELEEQMAKLKTKTESIERINRKAEDERAKQDAEHNKLQQKTLNEYEHKLGIEMLRFDKLSEDMETLTQRCEEALQKQEEVLRSEIERIKKQHTESMSQLQAQKKEVEDDLKEKKRAFEEELRQVNYEFQKQISDLKEQYTQKLAGETKEEAKKEAVILEVRNKMKKKKQRITELKHQRDDMSRKISRLELKNKNLWENLEHQKHTIKEMKQTLSSKEKDITSLRGNNRKLDNFRYVLDGKIQELLKERGPVNDHISKLENHIKDMYDELVNEFYEKKHTDRVLANKDLKIAGLSSDVKKLRVENREKDRTIQTICHDLTKAKNLTLASAIQAKFKQMYATYVRSEQAKSIAHIAGSGSSDGATVQEALRQRRHMERTTATLKHALKVKDSRLQTQTKLTLAQNSLLINECNNLRKENKLIKMSLHKAEERLKVLEKTKSAAQRRNAEASRSRTLPNTRGNKFNQTAGPRTSTSLATSFSISKPRTAAKARAGSYRGGTRIRGSTRSLADNSRQQAKLSSMLRQLDDNNREIGMQRIEIRRLRQQVKLLVQQLGPELAGVDISESRHVDGEEEPMVPNLTL